MPDVFVDGDGEVKVPRVMKLGRIINPDDSLTQLTLTHVGNGVYELNGIPYTGTATQ